MCEDYQLETLPNGARLVTQQVPAVRSAAVGLWVNTGSRHESAAENGAAHFIEHMVFKGTARRSAAALAQEMDALGGQVNAYTTKESTCFYARCLDSHLPQAVDLLCDIVFSPRLDNADAETERGVILEEIKMYEDDPQDLCDQNLMAAVYRNTPLGCPILGTPETLSHMTGDWLKGYHAAHYRAGDVVAALAGSFTPQAVEDLRARLAALPAGKLPPAAPAGYQQGFVCQEKPIEQNHLTLAFPGLDYHDERRFALQLLSTILGSGMSSRLWQEVREQRGLCYAVYSFGASHAETGVFGVYTALSKETQAQALTTIRQVISDFAAHGPTQAELDRARELTKANVLMSLESTQARMSSLGRCVTTDNPILTSDRVIQLYDAVTVDDLRTLAQELFDFSRVSLSAVGQVETEDYYRALCAGQTP